MSAPIIILTPPRPGAHSAVAAGLGSGSVLAALKFENKQDAVNYVSSLANTEITVVTDTTASTFELAADALAFLQELPE